MKALRSHSRYRRSARGVVTASPLSQPEGMPQHLRGVVTASERGCHSHPHPLKVLPSKRTPHLSLRARTTPRRRRASSSTPNERETLRLRLNNQNPKTP